MNLTPIEPNVVTNIPLKQILPDPGQPRREFDEEKLNALAEDIRERGVQEPIKIVKPAPGDETYWIKTGERRYRASVIAGLRVIPCLLAKPEKGEDRRLERLFDQVKENELREPLGPLDWAHTFKRMRDDLGLTVAEIAAECTRRGMKISRPHVSNIMRLLDTPEWLQSALRTGRLTAGHAKHITPALKIEPVAAELEALVTRAPADSDGPFMSVRQLQTEIAIAYRRNLATIPITDAETREELGYDPIEFLPDELKEHESTLGIVTLTHADGQTEYFAQNEDALEALIESRYAAAVADAEHEEDEEEAPAAPPAELPPASPAPQADDDERYPDAYVSPHYSRDMAGWRAAKHLTAGAEWDSVRSYVRAQLRECMESREYIGLAAWRAVDYDTRDGSPFTVDDLITAAPDEALWDALDRIVDGELPGGMMPRGLATWLNLETAQLLGLLKAIGYVAILTSADDVLLGALARMKGITFDGYRVDDKCIEAQHPRDVAAWLAEVSQHAPIPPLSTWTETIGFLEQHAEHLTVPDTILAIWQQFITEENDDAE